MKTVSYGESSIDVSYDQGICYHNGRQVGILTITRCSENSGRIIVPNRMHQPIVKAENLGQLLNRAVVELNRLSA